MAGYAGLSRHRYTLRRGPDAGAPLWPGQLLLPFVDRGVSRMERRDAQQEPATGTQDTSSLGQGLFLFHRERQLIQQHHGIEASIGEGPLHDRWRERDVRKLRQRPHIQRVAGHDEPRPPQITGQAVIAANEQHGPAAWQVLRQRKPRNRHAMSHAGYDREQECQEPT